MTKRHKSMRTPRASEFFICGIEGLALTKDEQSFLSTHPLGGIILFKRNIDDIAQVVALNQSIIETNETWPPLICVDQEGGRVARLRGICTDLPPMTDLAHAFIKDPHLAYRMGAMQGRELVALGFCLNFAPVCDIISHADNQVIGDRAFSDTPGTVAALVAQYIKGLQGAGVAACAKHFPGHGATSIDSHFALPVLDTDMEVLRSRELVPFKAAIEADVATMMTAHIVTKPLDTLPATLSEKTLIALLRHELGYKNVVISDDLDMKAVADHFSLSDIIGRGLKASVDLFIIGNDFNKAVTAIEILQKMIDDDEEIKAKASDAKKRIDQLRARFLGKPLAPDLSCARRIVRSSPHLELVKACS